MAQLSLPVGLLIDAAQLPLVRQLAMGRPRLTVIIDHMSRIRPGVPEAALPALLGLASLPNVMVKLSAVSSQSNEPYPHADAQRVMRPLVDEFGPDRLMWGSDWPHVSGPSGYAAGLDATCDVLDDAGVDRDTVLRGTAARIFGFTQRTPESAQE
jgi:L-fuconolactonase